MRVYRRRMDGGWLRAHVARGFTLIELMVTVAILAVLLSVAAPSFNEAILTNRLAAFANNFVASAQLARGEAIKRNATVTLCRSADGTTCAASGGWQQGWIVKHGSTIIQYQQALTAGYQMTSDSDTYSLEFVSSGVGTTADTLKLCRSSPEAGKQERVLGVSTTGRVSVTTTKTGVCS